ncbi:MAG: hypothetical protein A4E24_01664 [Methanomethylovorans sp. PtaU1.Bin093]|uniref:transcriptional regulator FilR1 domain-containing protein n=1 Tax=Methanomethylovorans sp. PtaU1.Bin093 TaxID=1811679 RepID=UPI0009D4383A|nr:transcriptional regulator FilR1 domain-containing protein [Methanomethylovorans sp. PtaU1.Bin093]OPY19418.1 MAG: hypothetical protein A4E24_01664 [Methanomethylovorans sp. PtaU1.Bin093]
MLDNYHFSVFQFTETGDYDQKYVIASSPSALQWAKKVFEYYLDQSVRVTDL